MKIETTFDVGDIVFLITDPEQMERMVTAIGIKPGHHTYTLSCGVSESYHYEMEISRTADINKQLNIKIHENDSE